MKSRLLFLTVFFSLLLPFNLIIAESYEHHTISTARAKEKKQKAKEGFEKRWKKVKLSKKKFIPYSKKSKKLISKEFGRLKKFRKELWYRNPNKSFSAMKPDYLVSESLKKNKNYSSTSPHLAFDYNCVSDNYNASHILIDGLHFIAMQGPSKKRLNEFFEVLIENNVSIVVRLKPKKEYLKHKAPFYWTDHLHTDSHNSFIHPQIYDHGSFKEAHIPYFSIDIWDDNTAIPVRELYNLIKEVRSTYTKLDKKGPIACHCSAGVGRAGTFIAAYIIAHKLDRMKPEKISIEEIVMKLSILRPLMVSVTEQYTLLYEFVDYYVKHKHS